MKKTSVLFLSLIILITSFAVLPACNKEVLPAPKRVIGIDSEKTYIKNTYYWTSFYYYKTLQLPMISLDPIAEEEIEGVNLKYESASAHPEVVKYELFEQTSQDGKYRYIFYIYLFSEAVISEHITCITVTINGKEYDFSADINLKYDGSYEQSPIKYSQPMQMVGYMPLDSGAQIMLMVSIQHEIEITDVSFQAAGAVVTGIDRYNSDKEWEKMQLPCTLDAADLILNITYAEPTDCLYYGNHVQLTFNAGGESITFNSAQGLNTIGCSGSALRG